MLKWDGNYQDWVQAPKDSFLCLDRVGKVCMWLNTIQYCCKNSTKSFWNSESSNTTI